MSAKVKYYESIDSYIAIEKELITFLKSASGEDLYAVFDTLKGIYDPSNEDSVLAAVYALEFDILSLEQHRSLHTKFVHERTKKEAFLLEHSDLICEVLTSREYDCLVKEGAVFDRKLFDLIKEFEGKREEYLNRFDVVYKPYSLEFDKLIEKLKDTSYWMYQYKKMRDKPKGVYDLEWQIDPFVKAILALIGCIGLLVLMFLFGSEVHRLT